MTSDLESILKKMTQCSSIVLREYISKFSLNVSIRFFSYGSNMHEGKFREDTRKNCFEFGLINVKKTVLQGYKRILGNKSERHGLAFTICPSEKEQVEGICHDVPIKGLKSLLKKEGLLFFSISPKNQVLFFQQALFCLGGSGSSSLGTSTSLTSILKICVTLTQPPYMDSINNILNQVIMFSFPDINL